MEDSSKNLDSVQPSTRAGGSQREEDEEDHSRKDQESLSDGELSGESNGEASNDTGGAESFEQLKARLIIRLRELGKYGARPLDPAALGFDPGPSRKGPFQAYKSIRVGWNMEKVWSDHLSALKAKQDGQARAHAEEEEASHQDPAVVNDVASASENGGEEDTQPQGITPALPRKDPSQQTPGSADIVIAQETGLSVEGEEVAKVQKVPDPKELHEIGLEPWGPLILPADPKVAQQQAEYLRRERLAAMISTSSEERERILTYEGSADLEYEHQRRKVDQVKRSDRSNKKLEQPSPSSSPSLDPYKDPRFQVGSLIKLQFPRNFPNFVPDSGASMVWPSTTTPTPLGRIGSREGRAACLSAETGMIGELCIHADGQISIVLNQVDEPLTGYQEDTHYIAAYNNSTAFEEVAIIDHDRATEPHPVGTPRPQPSSTGQLEIVGQPAGELIVSLDVERYFAWTDDEEDEVAIEARAVKDTAERAQAEAKRTAAVKAKADWWKKAGDWNRV